MSSSSSRPPASYQIAESEKKIAQFSTDLELAINGATKFRPYRRSAVLAFHWQNDDIGVQDLENELLHVFSSIYGFWAESFTIPADEEYPLDNRLALTNKLNSWSKEHSGKDTLRIVVYSGHASSADTTDDHWNLAGQCDQNTGHLRGPTLDWWQVRQFAEQHPGDLCYIFDCCSAASGTLVAYEGAEFMAASAWESNATSHPDFSFTRVLIDELRQLNGRWETIAGIYARIFRYAQQNQVGAAPVHIPKLNTPSVTIGRGLSRAVTRRAERESHRVLLSVKVRDDIPLDLTKWKDWLTRNLPPGILSTTVTVEGAFRGSSLLLFSIPIEVWTMMPAQDESYSFVGHVTSGNLLNHLPMQISTPSGNENQLPERPKR